MSFSNSNEAIRRLQERYAEATAREAAIVAELRELSARIGDVRKALGNPFYYSGTTHGRPENAEKSAEKFTGYESHEIGRRLVQDLQAVQVERAALREQLKAIGADVDSR